MTFDIFLQLFPENTSMIHFFRTSRYMSAYEFYSIIFLATQLKEKFNQSNLLLTATILISEHFDYERYSLSKLSESFDFINFVFDYKRTDGVYRIDNAMTLLDTFYTRNNIEKILESGVSPGKIVIGVHFSGPAFIMTSNEIQFHNAYGYGSICKAIATHPEKWQKTNTNSGLSIRKKGRNDLVIILESSRSIANKVRVAMKHGLAGIAPIYISSDDFDGHCDIEENTFEDFEIKDLSIETPNLNDTKFLLTRTVNEAITVTLNEINQRQKLPPTIPDTSNLNEEQNTKVVCPVIMPSQMEARNMSFDFEKVNWKLCTHVIGVDEAGTGINRILVKFFGTIFSFGLGSDLARVRD